MAEVGEHDGLGHGRVGAFVRWRVVDDADADFVCGAFEAYGYHLGHCWTWLLEEVRSEL